MAKGKRLLIHFLFSFIFAATVCLLLYAFVDPRGLFSTKNTYRDLSRENNTKQINLKLNFASFDIGLIGTSRMMRVDPNLIENYTTSKTVNFSIGGASMEILYELTKAIKKKNKKFIYGFDAFSINKNAFDKDEQTQKEYIHAINAPFIYGISANMLNDVYYHYIRRIGGLDFSFQSNKENQTEYDYNATRIEIGRFTGSSSYYGNYEVDYGIVKELARLASSDDVFIIFPKFQQYYFYFKKHGVEERFAIAIRILVQNTKAKVWSFYGSNEITANRGNFDSDGWHFKPKIASLIFARVYNDTSTEIPSDFGVLLTPQNIDSYLDSF